MVAKKGKKAGKKVKSLAVKSVSDKKAKGVKGGWGVGRGISTTSQKAWIE